MHSATTLVPAHLPRRAGVAGGATRSSAPPAFTLIELLVVVAIIALLISILLPSLADAKKQARTDICMSNQKQIATAMIFYSSEWNDHLPGGTWDWIGPVNPSYANATPLCWLGSLNGNGDRRYMPYKGTIFRYLQNSERVFKCPEDAIDKVTRTVTTWRNKPDHSYTAPALLTGASLSWLKRTWWPDNFNGFAWNVHWDRAGNQSLPWLLVEEDEGEYLSEVVDSAWSNVDILSNRHKGRACVAHIDTSVTVRKYQRFPQKLDAWKVYYERADGAYVTAGEWGYNVAGRPDIRFGYIKKARRLNPR